MEEHGKCIQERIIGELTATVEFFQEAEKRRDARDERIAASMEKIAAQGETLKAHADTLTRHENAFKELFPMVRALNSRDSRKGIVLRILDSRVGPYVLGAVVVGFLIDCICHYEIVKKVVGLFI